MRLYQSGPARPAKEQRFRCRTVTLETSLLRAAPKVGGGSVGFAADDDAL